MRDLLTMPNPSYSYSPAESRSQAIAILVRARKHATLATLYGFSDDVQLRHKWATPWDAAVESMNVCTRAIKHLQKVEAIR